MDQANLIVIEVKALEIPKLEATLNNGFRYSVDLKEFEAVYCFPVDQAGWGDLSISTQGFGLTWGSRFEVSVDQIVEHSSSKTPVQIRA